MDILIKNVHIIDGTGKRAYMGNVGIEKGKLVLDNLPDKADVVIEGEGKCLAPGFIDVHSHGDFVVGLEYGDLCKINQGVTTHIAGQCGSSAAPYAACDPNDLFSTPEGLDPDFFKRREGWDIWSKYAEYVKTLPKVCNMRLFVSFNSIRKAVMGFDNRKPTVEEMQKMKDILKDAMDAGAAGLSSGVAYVPATYVDTDELCELVEVILPYDGIYTSHIRNESWDLLNSVEEVIEIGRRTGAKVNVSHFKAMGRGNWGTHIKAIEAINKAIEEGIDITCDQYPYNCSMTDYAPCMPPWHFAEGKEKLVENLKQPEYRAAVRAEMEDPKTNYENLYLNAGGWDGITICTSPNEPEAEGLTFSQYAAKIGKDPFDAYFDLIIVNECVGTAVYHSISDDDIFDIIKLPYVMVGSDGIVTSADKMCHPRGWGTMVRAICQFTKDNKIMPLEQLIHKMTGMAAERYMLKGKGKIAEGMDADLVLFDYAGLTDCATYSHPTNLAEGIELVFVDGKIVYKEGKLTGEKPGKLL